MNPDSSKNRDLNLGDSIGLFALVFAFFAFVVDPTPSVKLLLLIFACICSIVFLWNSLWTYRWNPFSKTIVSMSLIVLLWGRTLVKLINQVPALSSLLRFWRRLSLLAHQPAARYFGAICLGAVLMLFALILGQLLRNMARGRQSRAAENKGFLDFKLEAEEAVHELPSRLAPIVAIIAEVGKMLQSQAAKVASVSASETKTQLRNIRIFSAELNKSTGKLRGLCNPLEMTARRFDDGVTGWSTWMGQQKNRGSGIQAFKSTLDGFAINSATAIETTDGYLQTVGGIRGISRHLNEAINTHIAEVERVRNIMKKMASCATAAVARLGEIEE